MEKLKSKKQTSQNAKRAVHLSSASLKELSRPMNRNLGVARQAKQDEFYTQYVDIQKEVEAYFEFDSSTFRNKVVYCNCDDPFESNFFKYFAANFNKLGLKKLVTTSYDGSPIAGQTTLFPEYNEGNGKRKKPKALAVILDHVKDEDGDGAANVTDVELFLKRNKAARVSLKGDDNFPGGDFRSSECIALLKEADIVVTNPPFSLFREFVIQLMKHKKKFLIVGPKNAITYKEIFPLIKDTKLWIGAGFANGNAYFSIPAGSLRDFADGVYDESTGLVKFRNVGWFSNLDHGRRHQRLPLMTMAENLKFSKHKEIKGKSAYEKYANYDAIEVPFSDAIPSDYEGAMGVPITFLDKYNPDQFEIIGSSRTLGIPMTQVAEKGSYPQGGPSFYTNNGDGSYRRMYFRIVVRHRTSIRSARGAKK